jgi:hypothetical protein
MNGQMLGKRAIRTNWATRQKGESRTATYEEILKAGDGNNPSVYLKNVGELTEADIRDNFEKYGTIKQIRLFSSKNYGFVVYESKENAAKAILEMSGQKIKGHLINCSWGRTQEVRFEPYLQLIHVLASTKNNHFGRRDRQSSEPCCTTSIPVDVAPNLSAAFAKLACLIWSVIWIRINYMKLGFVLKQIFECKNCESSIEVTTQCKVKSIKGIFLIKSRLFVFLIRNFLNFVWGKRLRTDLMFEKSNLISLRGVGLIDRS